MKGTILVLAAVLVLALAAGAQAETYLGVYGGYTYIPDQDIDGDVVAPLPGVGETEFDGGYSAGGKIGYWMKTLPWLAVELNVWNTWSGLDKIAGTEVDDIDLNLLNFSGSLLLQYVTCPWRIYAGGGVVGTWADLSNDDDSVDNVGIGGLGQAGLEYLLAPNWSVFVEYRYTWCSLEFEEGGATAEIDLQRHEGIGGLNFRF